MSVNAERAPFCGGTDAASIYCSVRGLPYYGSAWEVWAERHAPAACPPRDPSMKRWLDLGNVLEPFILGEYNAQVADQGLHAGRSRVIYGPEPYQWMRAQIDASILDTRNVEVGVVDAKSLRLRKLWFEQKGEVKVASQPIGYEIQTLWYLGLMRLEQQRQGREATAVWADLAGLDLVSVNVLVRRIQHDEDRWADILNVVIPWWERHILGGERPPDDHSETCRRWHLYTKRRPPESRIATDEERELAEKWVAAKASVKRSTLEADIYGARLLSRMTTDKLLMGPEHRAPYVSLQAGAHGSRSLRSHRFPDPER